MNDIPPQERYAAERDRFRTALADAVYFFGLIDEDTPGNSSMVKPKWWLEMMQLRRECIDLMATIDQA